MTLFEMLTVNWGIKDGTVGCPGEPMVPPLTPQLTWTAQLPVAWSVPGDCGKLYDNDRGTGETLTSFVERNVQFLRAYRSVCTSRVLVC